MMHAILDPAAQQARLVTSEILEGSDTTGCAVIDVEDDFTWTDRLVDWGALAIVVDLSNSKAAAVEEVNAGAEVTRARFITPGAGQALTYQRKEAEARAWHAEAGPSDAPFLFAEAAATGMAIADVVELVIGQADAWVAIGAAIEGTRRGALVAIDAAETAEDLAAARTVDWGTIG